MKQAMSFLLCCSLLLVSCQPVTSAAGSAVRGVESAVTGTKVVSYAVQNSDIVEYLAQAGRDIQPSGSYGFLSVQAFTQDLISFKATALTSGTNIGTFAKEDFLVRITLELDAGKGATKVRLSAEPRSDISDSTINMLIEALDKKFTRVS